MLSDADRLIGKLAGEGGRLPNPHVLMRPFVQREAVLSSKIEGTQATMGEVLEYEAGVGPAKPDSAKAADIQEIINYRVSITSSANRLKDLPLSQRLIKEAHAKLLEGVRGQNKG